MQGLKGLCALSSFLLSFSLNLVLLLETQCEVLEALQQQVKVERLSGGWAGPDSLGTGSVSGFGGWWLVAKAIP